MVHVFLANGFEEIEAVTVIDVLRRADITVRTVSMNSDLQVNGAHGIPVLADIHLEEVDIQSSDMLILPGGMPGTTNLGRSEALATILREAVLNEKFVSAICAAPSVLGKLGLLNGKKATCYPGFEKDLAGAELSTAPVVRDGKLITSRGPGTAMEFAYALVDILRGELETGTLKRGMLYDQ